MAIIGNYLKKKARNAARLARIPNTNKCELFETVRDEDSDNAVHKYTSIICDAYRRASDIGG